MAIFRLLHVTDLHISVPPEEDAIGSMTYWMAIQAIYPSRARKPALSAVAEFVLSNQATTDALILSGDLADDGERRNLEAALDFIEARPARSKSFLTSDGFPTIASVRGVVSFFVLPGNHDRFRTPARLPAGTEFDKVFGAYWPTGLGGVRSLLMEKSGSSLGLVAADFCLQSAIDGPQNFWGQGSSNPMTLAQLAAATARLRNLRGVAVVWVLHFPPLLDVEPELRLRSASEVVDLARKLEVSHVVAGHLHRDQVVTYNGVEVVCTGSAASDLRPQYGNSMRILDFNVDNGRLDLAHRLVRYNPAEAAFL
jgi:3',5'-cyclic AMP phosphodiesterase CpdA